MKSNLKWPITPLKRRVLQFIITLALITIALAFVASSVFAAGQPTVTSTAATGIANNWATLNGAVSVVNGTNITHHGFVWGTATKGDPGNTADSGTAYPSYWDNTGTWATDAWSDQITGLTSGQTIYWRAAAMNDAGFWAYSSERSFSTLNTDRFWIGNLGNWTDTAHWSLNSGGTGGASVPGSSNDVYFDANSFSLSNQVVSLPDNTAINCKNISLAGSGAKTPVIRAGPSMTLTWNIYGSFTGEAGVVLDWKSYYGTFNLYFKATGTITNMNITSSYSYPSDLYPNITYIDPGAGNHVTLGSNLNIGSLTISSGDLQTNGYILTVSGTLTSSGKTYGDTVVIKGLPSSALAGLNVGSISGANTFNNLNFGPGWTKDDIIELGGDQTVNGTFQALGASSTSRMAVTSTTTTARTITAAIVSCNHADFSYITGAGSGNWNLSANDSIDYASNTGITFTWPWNNTENIYWTGLQDNVAGSGYWIGRLGWVNNFTGNDYEWSNTSGGLGGGMPRHYQPGSTNNVFFNANSGFTIGNQTVTWAPGSDSWVEYVNNLDFTGSDAVAGPIWSDASGNYYPKFQVQGNLTLCAGITFTGSSDGFVLGGGAGTHTFTTGNANLGGGWPSWQINSTGGGKWVISGDVNYPVGWTWIAGTIDGYTNHVTAICLMVTLHLEVVVDIMGLSTGMVAVL